MSDVYVLGMNAKLYYQDGATWKELSNVRDVTLTMETGEADVTTRANEGWRATAATLRECTVEFEMLWLPEDDGFAALRTAFLSAGLVKLKVLDKENGQGPLGDFAITSFSRSEALEEAITVSVTAKLAKFGEWVEP